ncbi:MAG: hypothetical protein A3E85_01495 [Gammaproteobacteria bacterium RIFCSPHIGHO2_12_FULL_45_12]|nr:MAG: hypothetical protein A3E85_01495 [Gammaproteobacteria bacterium RIFCSPHIGHO2_12_FULL_45_12]
MIPITLTSEVVKSAFNDIYFHRGQQYYTEGRVTLIDIRKKKSHRWMVDAEVQGSKRYSYDVEIHIEQRGGRFFIRGECDCPMRINCKHVVATLLKVIAQSGKMIQEVNFNDMRQMLQYTAGYTSESTRVDTWLNDISHLKEKPLFECDKSYQVFFELSQPESWRGKKTYCKPILFKMLKSGGRSKTTKRALFTESNKMHFSRDDKTLLGRMMAEHQWASHAGQWDSIELREEAGELLFIDILRTSRCFWSGSDDDVALGSSITLSFHWATLPDGTQRLKHDHESPLRLFCIENPWYFDPDTRQIGRVNTSIPPSVIQHIVNIPDIPPEKSVTARQVLEKSMPKNLLPVAYKIKQSKSGTPSPRLHLTEKTVRIPNDGWSYEDAKLPVATVSFRYGDAHIPWENTREAVYSLSGKNIVRYKRDFSAEEAALRQITETHHLTPVAAQAVAPHAHTANAFFLKQDQDPAAFTLDTLPELRRSGWEVDVDKDYPWDIMDVSMDEWYADLEEEGSGIDWFGLELGILLPSGEKINLLPILQRYLTNPPKDASNLKRMITHLDDGRKISLPMERIQNAAGTLIDIFSRTTGPVDTLRLSRLEAMRLAQLQKALNAAALRWHGGQKILETARKLSKIETLPEVSVPDIFHGQLRSYQQTGLSWLQFLREYQFGGILSDDMGLGKTIQAIAHISVEKKAGRLQSPVLVVAPTSLMFNWQSEIQRFSPDLRVLLLHGAQRRQHHDRINEYDVVLTTYPLLARDKEVLLKYEFHLLILDEAQAIKNARSQAAHIVIQLRAKHRLCMTGTPMENHLGELWSLFHFMMPGFLGTEKKFKALFRVPIEKNQDEGRRKHLARIVSPFLLRRKKTDVAKELPDKTIMVQTVELNTGQRDLYETIRLSMQKKLRESIKKMGLARSHIMILDALLKLRQICCDPRLLKENKTAQKLSSAKLSLLMSMLPDLVEEGRRILLFSQFTGMLSLIEKELDAIQMPYVILTGQTRDRRKPVEHFQAGKVPIFLISLKAGGTGLNLTAADTVIHYDPWWNPAAENQATDRAHRIGQDKKVFVYRLVTQGTVEEKIVELQQRKQALAESLLNNDAKGGPAFSMNDLQILLGSVE